MKILITGGAGFQGSHLTSALVKKGHQVTILNTFSDRALFNLSFIPKEVIVVWGSVTDKEIVDKTVRGHDVVFHLAAHINVDESLHDPAIFYHVNMLGTHNILEAVIKYGSRLILTSTCEVYGDDHNFDSDELLDESAELRPNSPYAASKAGGDRMCYAYFRSFDVDVTIVRPFNIYGERQKNGRFGALIPILTDKALRNEDLIIFGDGLSTRDYMHVSDAVQGYLIVLENLSLKGKVINFASGKNTRIKDIADHIAQHFGVKVIHDSARPGEVSRFPADISFARSLGFNPHVDIREGLDRYIMWAEKNLK